MGAIFAILMGIAIRIGFGYAVKTIIESKGYGDNWFVWGFLFTWIAVIVALSKPNLRTHYVDEPLNGTVDDAYDYFNGVSSMTVEKKNAVVPEGPTWTCKKCGLINPLYTGSCSCGASKYDE